MKVKAGETVKVITGKDKGKEGLVLRVYPKRNKVLVDQVNMYKKHIKKSEHYPQGGIIDVPRLIDASNVISKGVTPKQKEKKKLTK